MSSADIQIILNELAEIKTQVKLTNGRVTRLERAMLLIAGIAIGAGLLKSGYFSIMGLWNYLS
jgi:hypothetical protein